MDVHLLEPWSSPAIPVGARFARLQVIETYKLRGETWQQSRYYAQCRCDCGTVLITRINNLRSENTQSCGCVMRDGRKKTRLSRTRIGQIWRGMMHRCYNPKSPAYKNYGGRGIQVCDQWHALECFAKDITSLGYAANLTIERIDNNGDYSPDNCQWIPKALQSKNKRSNVIIEFRGRSMCIADWARHIGIPYRTLRARLRVRGWPVERALTTITTNAKARKCL